MVPPNGPWAACSTSTWIHWWSPVASAKASTRSCSMVSQSLEPSSSPTASDSSSSVVKVRMEWKDRRVSTPTRDEVHRAPKVLLHDHLDGGLRPATIVEL